MDIFLVEDSQSIRRLLVQRLESMSGARIVGEADRQDDAQALIQWLQPETVLLDLSLATGSGLQVLNGLRRRGYRGRVMVLTSQSADTYRDACIAAGADGFYDKASGLETLIGDLDVILDAPRSGAATAAAAPARMPRDTLTGLCDQRSLLERTDQASKMVARDHGEMAAYVLMLGNLDALRDSHGEAAVAAALRETAARLSQACSPADVLARHADAQFALVLTRVESAAEATLFGQQLQQLMQPGFEFQGQALAIQAQLGMALYPRDAISARALLTLAEARAYGAVAPTAATVFTH